MCVCVCVCVHVCVCICSYQAMYIPSVQHMKATEGVYAAGDIVRFPLPLVGTDANIGHWQIAHNHGMKSTNQTTSSQLISLPLNYPRNL